MSAQHVIFQRDISIDLVGMDGPVDDVAQLKTEGYNQTYAILASDKPTSTREVLFRCGNWTYSGQVQFGGVDITLEHLTPLISTLQKQQSNLRYFSESKSFPISSKFYNPIEFLHETSDFIVEELSCDDCQSDIEKMSKVFSSISDDNNIHGDVETYFELSLSEVPEAMTGVDLIASKTYTRGLLLVSVYHDKSVYFVVLPGEGAQGLLDVRFPALGQHGQGLLLAHYADKLKNKRVKFHSSYRKLTLWQAISSTADYTDKVNIQSPRPAIKAKITTTNLSSDAYEQAYLILREPKRPGQQSTSSSGTLAPAAHRDALFRFGSWCYAGRVCLTGSELRPTDVPSLIPALRSQQSQLQYCFESRAVPITSPFAPCLEFLHTFLLPVVTRAMANSVQTLDDLVLRLRRLGLESSVCAWLEGAAEDSFFEFELIPGHPLLECLCDVEVAVCKSYLSSGVCIVCIYTRGAVYAVGSDLKGEAPLLDATFPSVDGKGRGYVLHARPSLKSVSSTNSCLDEWPALQSVTLWQSDKALQKEFSREHSTAKSTAASASSKSTIYGKKTNSPAGTEYHTMSAESKSITSSVSTDSDSSNEEMRNKSFAAATSIPQPKAIYLPRSDNKSSSFEAATESCDKLGGYTSNQSQCAHTSTGCDVAASPTAGPVQSRGRVAMPHHLPPLDKSGTSPAPWDALGRPLSLVQNVAVSKHKPEAK